jgi:16S rRNA (guanine(966)-N(2))-methyltransferase RsmD
MVRGAIFSALESATIDWSSALDLYAGTGALGIEALSRGSQEADFVDRNPKCCSIIRDNLKHTGFTERAHVYRLDAGKALRILKKQYSLIFLDPPYADESARNILAKIVDSDLAGSVTTIVLEHSQKLKPEVRYGNFQMINSLHHGDTHISIFQCEGGRN